MLTIVQGETKEYIIRCMSETTGDPIDLSAATEIKVCWKKTDGTYLNHTLTGTNISIVGSPFIGKFKGQFSAAESALLKVGQNQDLTVTLTFGADIKKMILNDVYEVKAAGC